MESPLSLTVPQDLRYLRLVCRFGSGLTQIGGIPENEDTAKVSHAIELALCEAFTNSVRHIPEHETPGHVIIDCAADENRLSISIKDRNQAFYFSPDPPQDVALSSEGGYGLFLIRKLMDTVSYQREGNVNVLSMSISFPK